MSQTPRLRVGAAGLAGMMLLSGCTTNPDGTVALDPKATGALIGAAAGCVAGAATGHGGKGCLAGAVIGATAGFLISWYFESKKLADAKTVNQEYEKQVRAGKLPKSQRPPKAQIVPVKFTSQVKHSSAGGQHKNEIQMTSNSDLIGYGDHVPQMQQKYVIYDEKNQILEQRTEKITVVDSAGRYQTQSKFTLPADAKNKHYTVKTTLLANNQPYKQNSYQVSFAEMDGEPVLRVAELDSAYAD